MIKFIEHEDELLDLEVETALVFDVRGDVTRGKIRDWYNILEYRLYKEEVLVKNGIQRILVDKYIKRVRKYDASEQSKKIVDIRKLYEEHTVYKIYVIINREDILDENSFNACIPLLLDCETIDALIDNSGRYRTYDKDIEDYILI